MSFVRRLTYGLVLGAIFFFLSLLIGLTEHRMVSTASLIGTSIVFEAQPAAAASLPLHFHPLPGALISILANLIPIPVLMLTFEEIIHRWAWARRRLQKAEVWSQKYGKYGVWVLAPLSFLFGAYISIAVGYIMRWNPRLVLCSILIGMASSTFLITYGGESIIRFLSFYL